MVGNSLAPGSCGSNFKSMIFKLIIWNNSLGPCVKGLSGIPQNLTNEKPALIHVMAWYCQVLCRWHLQVYFVGWKLLHFSKSKISFHDYTNMIHVHALCSYRLKSCGVVGGVGWGGGVVPFNFKSHCVRFVLNGPVDNKFSLLQVVVWHCT